ncbi:MAG: alpha/beta hydrolase [Deltaproteobacteria bacterium]|nr:alpha/beta hydrolase [Deltaproteobacteria bacterium]
MRICITLALAVIAAGISHSSAAQTPAPGIGIVIMHGKGGSPTRYVSSLASSLEEKGYLVANLEMPWSGRRVYDVNVSVAEKEVESALGILRSKGAKKLFVAGHSQGGLFALYFGGKYVVDGVTAIAPGGDVGNSTFREKLGESVALARKLIAEGKGDEKTKFYDYEGTKGITPVTTTPAIYFSWFDPDGAMNQTMAVKTMSPRVPVLYIGPKGDYPGLRKVKESMFSALPSNSLTKLYEPDSSHLNAPSGSRDEIARWITEVGSRVNPTLQGTPASGHP